MVRIPLASDDQMILIMGDLQVRNPILIRILAMVGKQIKPSARISVIVGFRLGLRDIPKTTNRLDLIFLDRNRLRVE
jgi:hypothetical protein